MPDQPGILCYLMSENPQELPAQQKPPLVKELYPCPLDLENGDRLEACSFFSYQLVLLLLACRHQPFPQHSGSWLTASSRNQALKRLHWQVSSDVQQTSCFWACHTKCLEEMIGRSSNHIFRLERTKHESRTVVITYRNHSLRRKLSCAVSSVGSAVGSVSIVSSRHVSHFGRSWR
jgi:hypothetical protein